MGEGGRMKVSRTLSNVKRGVQASHSAECSQQWSCGLRCRVEEKNSWRIGVYLVMDPGGCDTGLVGLRCD